MGNIMVFLHNAMITQGIFPVSIIFNGLEGSSGFHHSMI
jgi:hypothetical protein